MNTYRALPQEDNPQEDGANYDFRKLTEWVPANGAGPKDVTPSFHFVVFVDRDKNVRDPRIYEYLGIVWKVEVCGFQLLRFGNNFHECVIDYNDPDDARVGSKIAPCGILF